MKKTYQKPEIMFEAFSLSTNIAGDCETIVDNASRGSCPYHTRSDLNVFTSDVGACTTTEPDGDYNGICYHVPIDTKNLFNS